MTSPTVLTQIIFGSNNSSLLPIRPAPVDLLYSDQMQMVIPASSNNR